MDIIPYKTLKEEFSFNEWHPRLLQILYDITAL